MNKDNNLKNKKLIPLNDHAFKKMFGERGCEPQLMALINGLTNRTGNKIVKNIKILEKEIPRDLYNDKEIKLDVLAETDNGELINLEAQIKNGDMESRGIFYSSRLQYRFDMNNTIFKR